MITKVLKVREMLNCKIDLFRALFWFGAVSKALLKL